MSTDKEYQFPYKKVLILENEFWKDDDTSSFHHFYRYIKEQGVEFKIIDQAAGKDKKKIIDALKWCDALLFSSTFLYESDVKSLGDLLTQFPMSKTVIGFVMGTRGSLQYYLEKIWSTQELASMSQHKVFELVETHTSLGEPLKEIDMVHYKTIWDKEEKERIEKNHNMPKTGRKVVIGVLHASGEQWSTLKEGDVVDELDCMSIDPNPSRGVWVMGKDEPVKLLNDSGYEEFKFAELTAKALTLEFFSRGSCKDLEDIMETVEVWIYNVSGKIDNTELWEWCDRLCRLTGVERRGNRSYFESRLKEYRSQHQFFKEASGDPRLKKISAFK